MPLSKEEMREYMRKRRAGEIVPKKSLVLDEKEAVVQTGVSRTEMARNEIQRERNEDDLLKLFEQRCDLCNRTWGASIPIICPYCHGKIKKAIPV